MPFTGTMQKVKDLEGLIDTLRGKLRAYLELISTRFSSNGQQFQCPRRATHANNDSVLSCNFFPDESHWHCFACDDEGDIFSAAHFLENRPKDGIRWIPDTVLYLADRLHVPYEFEELTAEEKCRQQMFDALREVAELAHRGFLMTETAKAYARNRGWDERLARRFLFGWCSYEKLLDKLQTKGYPPEVLRQAGLTTRTMLDHRLLFPIKDEHGRVIGFTSRTLLSKEEARQQEVPLYVNSDTNVVYKKSRALFNIHQIEGDTVWLVEGPADVISLDKHGVHNAVALCGVALTDDHFRLLTRKGIRTVIFCLDNDKKGREAEEEILNRITRAHGLSVYVKNRDGCIDVDDCLRTHDVLLTSGQQSMFEYYLGRYKETQRREYRDKTLRAIFLEKSPIDQDNLCKRMAAELDVRREVIWEELNHLIDREGDVGLISQLDILREKSVFERQLARFEKEAWSHDGKLLGLACGFPIFTEVMSGIQPAFYIIAGEEGTGKSSLSLNLAMNILKAEPKRAYVLYFSIDDTVEEVIARCLAMEAGLEINAMKNPRFEIERNTSYSQEQIQQLLGRYHTALTSLRGMASHLMVKDESEVKDIHDMERIIRTFKQIAEEDGRQLVVFIDSLHRITNSRKFHQTVREAAMEISNSLKRWRNTYKLPVIATAELRKLNDRGGVRPTADDIKEASDFKYDVNVMLLLYNDLRSRKEYAELKFLHGEGLYPVLELNVDKNKTSSFQRRLYFKFYPPFARIEECTWKEQEFYHSLAFPKAAPLSKTEGSG